MNNLTNDSIAIDTNVFEHLFNPDFNTDAHINQLLTTLGRNNIELIVDKNNKIWHQYRNRIEQKFYNSTEKGNELSILRLWFREGQIQCIKIVNVDLDDQLMRKIDQILCRSGRIDKIFVYVAFKAGRILITNDLRDMIHGHPKENEERRITLKNKTKKERRRLQENSEDDQSDILTSKEAHAKL